MGLAPALSSVSERPSRGLIATGVTVAILAISTAAVLVRSSEAPSVIIAFYRLAIATALLGAAALVLPERRREIRGLGRRDWLGLGLVGVVLAIHFWSWFVSLELTTVAASVVLVTLHPVLVAVVSRRLYGEGLTGAGWLGVAVALAGGVLIAGTDYRVGLGPLLGDGLALVGALAAATYFLAGRGYRQRFSLLAYVVPVYLASTLTLLALSLLTRAPLTGYPLEEYAIFAALALLPMVLGHTVLNWALRHVTAPVIATTVLAEPVGASLLAYLVLAEVPPAGTLVGGGVVLAGIGLVVVRGRRLKRAPEA